MGRLKVSFGTDTGAVVNVLSRETYLVLQRVSRGNRWSLRPNSLNLVGVTSDSLKILGIVHLPISLSEKYSHHPFGLLCDIEFRATSGRLAGIAFTSVHSNGNQSRNQND